MHEAVFMSTIEQFSYAGIFVFALFSGYFIPVPEEIILLITGYMAAIGVVELVPAICVVAIAFVIGDNVLFRLARKNDKFVGKLIHEVLSLKIISRNKAFLQKNVRFAIFFTRFIPFLRFVGPVFAGYVKAKETTFMTFNTLAIAIYAPVVVSIGYAFQGSFSEIVGKFDALRHIAVIVVWIVIGFIITRITDYTFRKSDLE